MPIDAATAQAQWVRFCHCRDSGHLDFVAKAARCDAFVIGDQWLEQDLNALKLQRRPALTINKILPTIGTLLGAQITNRTEVLFRPANGAPSETADALSKVWMQISQNNQLPWVRSDVFADGLIRGRGFYDVRLDFTDAMEGEVRIALLNSKNVIIDPDAKEYDPDQWNDVFTTKWLTYQDISILYSDADAQYLKDKEGSSYPYGYDSIERVRDRFAGPMPMGGYVGLADPDGVRRNIRVIERQHRKLDKREHFVDIETGDMRPVPADWDKQRIADLIQKTGGKLSTTTKLVKRIRWTVTADNVVLHDDWSPYQHFTVIPYFPFFRYGKTIGIVENLLGPQEILNKASSQELHVINTTANSGWVVEQDSLVNMSVEELEAKGAMTGLVIEHKKGSQAPVKIQPNQTPSGLDRITYKAEEHIKSISNVTDSMMGNDRADVAAKAIAYKQQQGSISQSKAIDNLSRTDWMLARNVLALVQEFYTEQRIIDTIHDDVTQKSESITVNEEDNATGEIKNDLTLGEYDIVVTSAPFRNSLEDSQFEQARALKELGIAIPDSVLIENSHLMRRSEIVKQIEGGKNSPEAQAQMQLQQRSQQAEVAKTEAEAQKAAAEAQKITMEAHGGGAGQAGQAEQQRMTLEQQRLQMEMGFEQERLKMEMEAKQQELEFKREELQIKMQMQREQHGQDMEIKQQQAEQQAHHADKEALAKRAQALRQAQQPTP
jgi:hypothetical protein